MRVLILGAAGRAAGALVYFLRSMPGIERLYLADNDAEALCRRSADLARLETSARYLDAENERALLARMEEADLVLGCLGPFHLHEARIVRASMAAGVDYVSMCDDPHALREVRSMDREAARAGVRILSGCGLTPGLSDVLACRAAARLDEVKSIEIAWFLELGPALGAATLEHLMRSLAGKSPVRRGGGPREVRAGSWEEVIEFPPPVGVRSVSYLSHPEPDTPGAAADVWFKAGVGSRARNLALQILARLGEGERGEVWRAALRAVAVSVARRGDAALPAALRITAVGERAGAPAARTLCVMGDYYRISGLVMAAAVDSLTGDAREPGVHTPQGVLDNPAFFTRLRRAGVPVLVGEGGVR